MNTNKVARAFSSRSKQFFKSNKSILPGCFVKFQAPVFTKLIIVRHFFKKRLVCLYPWIAIGFKWFMHPLIILYILFISWYLGKCIS